MKLPIDKPSVLSKRNGKASATSLGDRLAASTAAMRKRDVIDVRKPPRLPDKDIASPTAEQMRHADYVLAEVLDKAANGRSIKLGKAYQRQPRFETIEGLSAPELKALRAYRAAYDRSAISETKSALDIRPRGGGGAESAIYRVANMAFANIEIRRIEARIPIGVIATLRAVALHDQDFKAVAIGRFGGRDVQRIVTTGKKAVIKTSLQVRSGRHREMVREEFMQGAALLVGIVAPVSPPKLIAIGKAAEPPRDLSPIPPVDPAYLDEQGRLLPSSEIADIIRGRASDEAA